MSARSGIRKTIFLIMLFIAAILYLTLGRLVQNESSPGQTPQLQGMQELGVVVFPEPQSIETFSLVDQDGKRVAKPDLRGQWTLAFLGHTDCGTQACEDVISSLSRFADQVTATGETLPQFWYVSVDPQGDTPAVLDTYRQSIDLPIRAITGPTEQLQGLARSLKGAFNPSSGAEGGIEFSGQLGLISPRAELVAIVQPPFDSQKLAQAYFQLRAWYQD